MLFMGLFWIGLIVALMWGVRRLFSRERRADRDVAREVIGRRYAAGEFSEAEYRQAVRTLEADERGRARRRHAAFTLHILELSAQALIEEVRR